MSSKGNKSAKRELERIYGKICMIEAAGIRYIPPEKRKKIKGYSKYDDVITYHHIKERMKGGQATVENGAILKGYNHRWLHTLPDEEKEKVNRLLLQFKVDALVGTDKGIVRTPIVEIPLGINPDEEYTIIPVFDTPKKQKFNRAKEKRDLRKKLEEYYTEIDEDDDWER